MGIQGGVPKPKLVTKQATMKNASSDIVIKYLELYTDWPSLTLAKKIYAENSLEFKDVESVRSSIRVYRGTGGSERHVKDKRFLGTGKYTIPKEESEDFSPYKMPIANNKIGVISDLHIPNHRAKPIEVAFDFFHSKGANTIILNGDILDNTPFSRHDGKRPSASDVRRWFDQTEYFFEGLRDAFPTQKIVWTEGNHDFWYRRWMNQHAWQLDDDPYFSLQERLHIEEYKISFIPQTQYVLAGKLAICHGHQLGGKWGVGVAPARNIYNKTKKSVLIGHVHKSDSYTETDLQGDIYTCYTTGCNCTLTPEYQPFAGKANHGAAFVTVEKSGDYSVDNIRVHKGKIY